MFRISYEDALSETNNFILVDWSDTTNYRHSVTAAPSFLRALGWAAWMRAAAAEELAVKLGLLVEVDATDGSVHWFDGDVLEVTAAGTDRTGYRPIRDAAGDGLAMRLSGAAPEMWVAGEDQILADSVVFQTDVTLVQLVNAANVAPAAGDLILQITERGGTAAFEFGFVFDYDQVRLG